MSDIPAPQLNREIETHFEKGNFFRVVHVDGCYGGITPRGTLHMAVYSERTAIPESTKISFSPEGQPGPEIVTESKQGVIRELEVDLVMDINVAVAVHTWLRDQVEILRRALGIQDEQWTQMLGGRR
jgi:hypothetical protein